MGLRDPLVKSHSQQRSWLHLEIAGVHCWLEIVSLPH